MIDREEVPGRGSSVVEQRTENPCVESSILSPGTLITDNQKLITKNKIWRDLDS